MQQGEQQKQHEIHSRARMQASALLIGEAMHRPRPDTIGAMSYSRRLRVMDADIEWSLTALCASRYPNKCGVYIWLRTTKGSPAALLGREGSLGLCVWGSGSPGVTRGCTKLLKKGHQDGSAVVLRSIGLEQTGTIWPYPPCCCPRYRVCECDVVCQRVAHGGDLCHGEDSVLMLENS